MFVKWQSFCLELEWVIGHIHPYTSGCFIGAVAIWLVHQWQWNNRDVNG